MAAQRLEVLPLEETTPGVVLAQHLDIRHALELPALHRERKHPLEGRERGVQAVATLPDVAKEELDGVLVPANREFVALPVNGGCSGVID
jgi:hypothetical protein